MMIKHIATVAVYVDNQEEAKEFWTEKVGFIVHAEHEMGPKAKWLEVGPEGAESCLVIYPKSLMTNWQELKPSIVFECEDIAGTYERLTAKGVHFPEPLNKMAWGTFAKFVDLDGNEFLIKG
jgi:lactoylglutathione lyase